MPNNKILYKNIKNDNLYEVINMDVIDKNSDRNDDRTIYYTDGVGVYTRRYKEFYEKFIKIEVENYVEKITSVDYVKRAIRTESNDMDSIIKRFSNPVVVRLVHSIMGLTTETGEFMDVLKRHLFYGDSIDFKNLKEEIGDEMWYIALAIDALETTLDEVMSGNIEKLRKRFPEKFTKHDALNRDTNNELTHI